MRAYEENVMIESPALQERLQRLLEAQETLRPLSTYRLQFNKDFRIDQACELLDYLDALGISHVYASPLLRARAGSTHGYDIADHNSLNPEIGDEVAFAKFASALHSRGMGLIIDTVPNHMGIGKGDNRWWQDVLRNGQSSEFAEFFDIDWEPLKPELRNKVLLPILGNQYGEELESGRIRLTLEASAFKVCYFDNKLPLDPRSIPSLFAGLQPDPEFSALLRALQELPAYYEANPDQVQVRRTQAPLLLKKLSSMIESSSALTAMVHSSVRSVNGTPGVPVSFDALHALLEAQVYRLAHWRVSGEEINYRRFFDVNDLVGLRMENPRVFAETHGLLRRLMAEHGIAGVRVDHCDGLLNPRQYLIRMQMLYVASQLNGAEGVAPLSDNGIELEIQQLLGTQNKTLSPFYCVVEKILEPGESLPEEWPVDGTSGYDFIRHMNGIFIQRASEQAFTRLYDRFIGSPMDFERLLYDSKKVVMHTSLASEVNVLAHLLDEISSTDRHARDFTRKTLRDVIRETIACFPVYRSYVDERGEIFDRDRAYIQKAIAVAKAKNTGTATSVFDFLRDILLTPKPLNGPDQDYRRRLQFILKFQQLTGPVMAKGLEDTLFYVYNRFISLNEVGGYPREFGNSIAEFHYGNLQRLSDWPNAMLASSTHDTKRSEDVRARLNVLSELPQEWSAKVQSWRRQNNSKKVHLADGRLVPDANEEFLLYQTLVGAWPLAIKDHDAHDFVDRIQQYMFKAIHESKVNVSWINQDEEYSQAMAKFITHILEPSVPGKTNFFLRRLQSFLPSIQYFGAINSLSQTLLKLTSPGAPDIYQGTELFEFSLVDPDNRRPVDFVSRREALQQLLPYSDQGANLVALCRELMHFWADGRIKLWTNHRVLQLRREHSELFRHGSYLPLSATGEKPDHICAFMREHNKGAVEQVIVAVPRFAHTLMKGSIQPPVGEVWSKNALMVASGATRRYQNVFTGESLTATQDGAIACQELFANFPVALLVSKS
ncbi:MAG TPA: malto-oligosyltrehalose synthase [Terriglobales bacterium]|nr:malto-oligosyltrehalose synthase [Terriglobales bacterium]